jgi:tetratricopeptide (TPR) repeat protein
LTRDLTECRFLNYLILLEPPASLDAEVYQKMREHLLGKLDADVSDSTASAETVRTCTDAMLSCLDARPSTECKDKAVRNAYRLVIISNQLKDYDNTLKVCQTAITVANELIASDRDERHVRFYRGKVTDLITAEGEVYRKQGDLSKARQCFVTAMSEGHVNDKFDHAPDVARYELMSMASEAGDVAETVRLAQEQLRLMQDRTDDDANWYRGQAYWVEADLKAKVDSQVAIGLYRKAWKNVLDSKEIATIPDVAGHIFLHLLKLDPASEQQLRHDFDRCQTRFSFQYSLPRKTSDLPWSQ